MNELQFVLPVAGVVPLEFTPVVPGMNAQMLDRGLRIVVQMIDSNGLPVNIHTATTKLIKLQKPSGVKVDIPAAFVTNGYDGKLYFTTTNLVPPLDQAGIWFVQSKIVMGTVAKSTHLGSFEVLANIDNV